MTKLVVNEDRVRRDLRKSTFATRVLSVILIVAAVAVLRWRAPNPATRNLVWLGVILFGLLPALTCLLLAEGLKRRRFSSLVAALTVTCSDLFLMLIAATFISTGIVAENISKLIWPHVIVMAALSLPFGWTIYTLMRSFDSMRPDDWNVG